MPAGSVKRDPADARVKRFRCFASIRADADPTEGTAGSREIRTRYFDLLRQVHERRGDAVGRAGNGKLIPALVGDSGEGVNCIRSPDVQSPVCVDRDAEAAESADGLARFVLCRQKFKAELTVRCSGFRERRQFDPRAKGEISDLRLAGKVLEVPSQHLLLVPVQGHDTKRGVGIDA